MHLDHLLVSLLLLFTLLQPSSAEGAHKNKPRDDLSRRSGGSEVSGSENDSWASSSSGIGEKMSKFTNLSEGHRTMQKHGETHIKSQEGSIRGFSSSLSKRSKGSKEKSKGKKKGKSKGSKNAKSKKTKNGERKKRKNGGSKEGSKGKKKGRKRSVSKGKGDNGQIGRKEAVGRIRDVRELGRFSPTKQNWHLSSTEGMVSGRIPGQGRIF